MQQFFPDDAIWRNVRLATMDPERDTPYGLVDGHALIVRQGIPVSKVRDTVWAYPTCGYELKYMV